MDGAGRVTLCNTVRLLDHEILPTTYPKEGFLEQTDDELTARGICHPSPARRAAFRVPVDDIRFFLDPNDLIGVIVEKISEGFDAHFDLHFQGQEAKG